VAGRAVSRRKQEHGMDLARIIETAKRRDTIAAQSEDTVIEIRLDGTPSYLMSNAVAAFQSEVQDIFLHRASIVGGGSGCLYVEFALADLASADRQRVKAFFSNPDNLAYFQRRYGINAITLK
jgi:hypothetical protein